MRLNPRLAACVGAAALCTAAATARSAEVEVCFDYSCHRQASARFDASDLAALAGLLEPAADAAAERAAVAEAIGRMYAIAARQTPIWRDRGRNLPDLRHLEGAMDCIDHSTNTDAFLRLLWREGLLRHHAPGERQLRFAFLVFGEHWTATLIENASGAAYAVDSWFHDPGLPAEVVSLERWRAGYDPDAELGASR